jgi:hypothetical protein
MRSKGEEFKAPFSLLYRAYPFGAIEALAESLKARECGKGFFQALKLVWIRS